MEVYKLFGHVTKKEELYPYFCYMSNSIMVSELNQCIKENTPKLSEVSSYENSFLKY